MSKREAPVAIISIAQQARPNVIGQRADLRAQLKTKSTVVVMMFFSKRSSIQAGIITPFYYGCALSRLRFAFITAARCRACASRLLRLRAVALALRERLT